MSEDGRTCPEGYTSSDLLELLDDGVVDGRLNALGAHVRDCSICAAELASLRKIHGLLIRHPESFHPDEVELYQYAHGHESLDENIAEHVLTCPECGKDVEIIREMIEVGNILPESPETMPQSLLDRLEASPRVTTRPKQPGSLFNIFIEFYRSLMHRPILAMGTAAAVLLIIVVTIPYVKTPQIPIMPESSPVPSVSFQDGEKTATEPAEDKKAQVLKPAPKEPAAPGRIYRAERRKMKPKLNFAAPQKGAPPLERKELAEEDSQPLKREGRVGSSRPAPVTAIKRTGDVKKYSPKQTILKSRGREQAEVSKQDLQKRSVMQPSVSPSTEEQKSQPSATRVNVVITGPERVHIPILEFTPSPSLKDHHTFVVTRRMDSEAEEHKAAELSAGISEPEALAPNARSLTVLVRISKLNGLFKIWADVMDSTTGDKSGALEEFGIAQDELGRRIESAVSTLIKRMDSTESQK